jgi:hypothetical protein
VVAGGIACIALTAACAAAVPSFRRYDVRYQVEATPGPA